MGDSVGDHAYRECGMDHVTLHAVTKFHCTGCGERQVQIVAMARLHRCLAGLVARKPARLVPSEVRFVRDHLELTNREFSKLMGVTESQASRWTTSDPMGVPAELLLRMLAVLGPDVLDSRRAAIARDPVLDDLLGVLDGFPSTKRSVEDVPIDVRLTDGHDWVAVR